MRLLFIYFIFISFLFSNNGKRIGLGGSGSIDLGRASSINYFEAGLANDKQEPSLSISISMKSSHQNILSQTDKINIYKTQQPDIAKNLAVNKVSSKGIASVQNALNAIEDINKHENNNMIEYIFPNFTLSYRFRNIGFSFNQKSYGYAYIHSKTNLDYNKNAIYIDDNVKYSSLKSIFDNYMQSSLELNERYITLSEFFMSYANAIPISDSKILYGLSINLLNADYLSDKNTSLNRFDNNAIYENARTSNNGVSSPLKASYSMSFIFVPPKGSKLNLGIAFVNINPNTFGDFYYDSKIILSGNYLLSKSLKLHYEKDLKEYKNIYKTNINKKQSFGLELKLKDVSLYAGYESNINKFKDSIVAIGLSYKMLDIGYRTKSNFANYLDGSLKDFGELAISFKKET